MRNPVIARASALAALALVTAGCAAQAAGHPGSAASAVVAATAKIRPTAAAAPPSAAPSAPAPPAPASGAGAAPAVTPAASPGPCRNDTGMPGTCTPVRLRLGSLVLHVPHGWRVSYADGHGDYSVGLNCTSGSLFGSMTGSACPSFSLISNAGATQGGGLTTQAYSLGGPYQPSTGVLGCPGKPGPHWERLSPKPSHYQGFAHVTPGKTAYYSNWTIGCGRAGANGVATPSFYFQQLDWYLPVSKVLIMTEYNIPGLANILASASWR